MFDFSHLQEHEVGVRDPGNVDYEYRRVVQHVLTRGTRKENRTGVDTLSAFGLHYSVDLRYQFPLLTTKTISWKNIVVELLWFLSGRTDVEFLRRHGCKFWDAWADERGEVPSAYGSYWRRFPSQDLSRTYVGPNTGTIYHPAAVNDQLAWAVAELRRNPMSRRVVVSAWSPDNAQQSKLPPCHCLFVFNVQVDAEGTKRLCCHLTQRSCDLALGVPYNVASYALLTHLVARFAGLEVGEFSHSLVDAHVYTACADGSKAEYDHVPNLHDQLRRVPRASPRLSIDESILSLVDVDALIHDATTDQLLEVFRLDCYEPHPAVAYKVAV